MMSSKVPVVTINKCCRMLIVYLRYRFISTGAGWDLTVAANSAKVYRFDDDPNIGEMDKTMV